MPRLGLQFLLLATAIISTSWAQDDGSLNLTLTAKEAVKLYIDGVLHDLPNERNMSATDTIAVSRTSRLLAFQCINLLPTCPGIIASMTDDYFLSNASWKCFEISGGETWTDLGFDDSHWPNATEHRPNNNQTDGSDCSNVLPYVPSISANAFWVWMEDTVQDIIYCRAYLPVCSSSPCQNGATCNVNEVEQCSCVGGYTGYYCETEINECDSGPCLNGATCQDLLNAFECSCADGYTGISCETEISECSSEPCVNGATCQDLLNAFECSCAAGYTGIRCETEINECDSEPCLNGATCQDLLNAFECSCAAGYTGISCETEISECDSGPCLNGATCQDLLNAFECSCADGYTGISCETDVQECDSTPCLNNGTCEEFDNGYQCSCPANYTGYDCETKVDDCLSLPCQNNGTCVADSSDSGGYICLCDIGFTGSHCESVPTVTLIITADRNLILLYVDNVSYTMSNSSNWAAPDHIAIPESSTLIAVRASSAFDADCSGILGSIGAVIVTNADWKCSTDNTLGWQRTDYNDSHWPQAITYDSNTPPFLCQYHHQIQDISPSANWIWTNDTSVSINCRLHLGDPCNAAPCLNGGTCSSTSDGGYSCSCEPRFTGINCETVPTVTLIITADRNLVLLYVDDVSYTMRNSSSWAAPDHIAIPTSSTLIALRAANAIEENCSGILGSIGATIVTNADWKCSTDNTLGWQRTDFNDSHWPQAITYDSNTPPFLCQYHQQIQDISPSANWIWTNDTRVAVNCRLHLA